MAFYKNSNTLFIKNSSKKRKVNSKNKIVKQLKVLSLATLLSFYCPSAVNAVGISEKPEDLTNTTLDNLHNNNVLMPNGEVYPKSGYTLKEISDPGVPMPNVITKYILDSTTKKIVPHYFEVTLRKGPSDTYEHTITTHSENTGTTNYNSTEFKNISVEKTNADFTEEEIKAGKSVSNGGALTNTGNITSINNSNFVDNTNKITVKDYDNVNAYFIANGGAIHNEGEIGEIKNTNFTNNAVIAKNINSTSDNGAYGGAIDNAGIIGNIIGNFNNNSVTADGSAKGGAIYNDYDGAIENITGDFIGNSATADGSAKGGAIHNDSYEGIGSITGDFIKNSATSTDNSARGGAIGYSALPSRLVTVTGISDNTTRSITGDFIENSANSTNGSALGGAIYNNDSYREIGSITGDFIGNSATSTNDSAYGGAIYNDCQIGNITGDFIENSATSTRFNARGGAIDNEGWTENITGDFIRNSATSTNDSAYGGAIYNDYNGEIKNITGNFIENSTNSTNGSAQGGAISNYACYGDDVAIENITGDFIENSANSINGTAHGGGIYNQYFIISIMGDFIGNSANSTYRYAEGGAIYNHDDNGIENITGNFIKNSANATDGWADGGAIYNEGEIGNITGDFIENSVNATNGNAIGGAIYNIGEIESIAGDFNNNKVTAISNNNEDENMSRPTTSTVEAAGGAIYNDDKNYGESLINTKGNFVNNSANATSIGGGSIAAGGAIFTNGIYTSYGDMTTDIIPNFTKNSANATSQAGSAEALGGALVNVGEISGFEGNFEENTAVANSKDDLAIAQGGAIYNSHGGKIYNIKGNFIKNSATAISTNGSSIATGGAIYGSYDGTIADMASDFIENKVVATSESTEATASAGAYGGAISTRVDLNYDYSGKIQNITGDFTGNSAIAHSKAGTAEAKGGAIYHQRGRNDYNYEPMSLIDTSFINNKVEATSKTGNAIAQGGAIYTEGEVINLIAANNNIIFLGNSANGVSNAVHLGAAKDYDGDYYITQLNLNTNNGKKITFNDSITSSNEGGIESKQININYGIIPTRVSEGTDGTVILNADMSGYTGEVNLYDGTLKVGENGTFFGNDTNLVNLNFEGGNLDLTNNKIDKIILNEYSSTDDSTIMLDTNLDTGEIDNFTVNSVMPDSELEFTSINILKDGLKDVLTLFNNSTSPKLLGESTTFTKTVKYTFTPGAASGTIDVGRIEGNYGLYDAVKDTSHKRTYSIGEVEVVNQDLTDMLGGNDAELTIAGNGNSIEGEGHQGIVVQGAQTLDVQKIGSVDSNGNIENSWQKHNSTDGGAITNSGNLKITSTIFNENKATQNGGAIKNDGIAEIENTAFVKNSSLNSGGAIHNEGLLKLTDTSFIGNSVDGKSRAIKSGGAIQNTGGEIILDATNSDINFIGNTVNGVGNDIHTQNILNPDGSVDQWGTVTFTGPKNTNITGGISGDGDVLKEGTGSLNLGGNNGNFTGDFILDAGSVNLGKDSTYFNAANTYISGGTTFNMANNQTSSINFGNLDIGGKTNIGLDVDLAQNKGDYISANSLNNTTNGALNIKNVILISDSSKKEAFIDVIDTSNGLSQIGELDSSATSALGPIYKYGISYDKNTGQLHFNSTGGGGGGDFTGYNPAILTAPVAQQVAYLGMVENYINAFANMDMVMLMPKKDRDALLYKNRYAAADGSLVFTPSMMPEEDKGLWFRPYSTFEKVNLNNGPDVSNIMYGSLFGGDSPIEQTKWGFSKVFSAYAGYTGSHQTFDGQGIYQNGGLLGATTAFYKGDFFTGLTANVGAIQAQASTNFGQDNFTMITAGIASKSGYNFGFLNEKLIIQPSFMMSYSFVNTFDYTTSSNVSVSQKPLSAIQIVPGIKLIGNLKNNWQPYLAVSMVWNIMDKTRFRANDVSLPDLSVDPYVLYGIGVQKHWGERFTGFAQSMFRSGGRNGVGLQLGFRWSI